MDKQLKEIVSFDQSFVAGSGAKKVMKEMGATSRDLYMVDPRKLIVKEGFNPRVHDAEYKAGIEELAGSMANGFLQDKPLAGYIGLDADNNDQIYITDGHRRLEAVLLAISNGAPIETVPVVIKPASTSMADLTAQFVTSNDGKPFKPYELAIVVKRLEAFGWDQAKIAKTINKTETYVGMLAKVAASPESIQQAIKDGMISAAEAVKVINKDKSKAAETVKKRVENAKAKGKSKSTASDDEGTEESRRLRRMRKHAQEAFDLLGTIYRSKNSTLDEKHREAVKVLLEQLRGV